MKKIDRLKNIWDEIYNPNKNTESTIKKLFHKDYTQCINGLAMNLTEYIQHVISQKQTTVIETIEYKHYLENDNELFAIYYPKGKDLQNNEVEAEVICYFQFKDNKLCRAHGQVRLIKGNYSDVDM